MKHDLKDKLFVAFIVLCIAVAVGGIVTLGVYCHNNPQVRICQPECDPDDWAEQDEDCKGLSGPNSEDID